MKGIPAAAAEPRKVDFLPVLLFLLFTSLPAWVGTGSGYDVAAATGGNVRRGAAGGAFQATGCAMVFGCFAVSMLLAMVMSGSKGGGLMTPGMAWLVMSFFIGLLGVAAALAGGTLAALGAWLGAGSGRRAAQMLAALLAAGGAVLAPFLLGLSGPR